jgi:hypothetical protein
MNAKTRSLLQEIRRKVKNPITGTFEFRDEESVIDYAIKTYYDLLKKQRLI